MRLNKATSHALRILVACARAGGELRKIGELAAALDLTQQNALKIAHLLSRAGFIEAERGRYGGIRLARDSKTIRVGDVVVAMEGVPEGGQGKRQRSDVGTDGPLFGEAFEAFVSVLNQTTIADMAAAPAAPRKSARQASKATARSGRLKTGRARTGAGASAKGTRGRSELR